MNKLITDVIHRAPDWLRRDLLSDDRNARAAAEEALSAVIESAIRNSAGFVAPQIPLAGGDTAP